jgi:hypothetical protein
LVSEFDAVPGKVAGALRGVGIEAPIAGHAEPGHDQHGRYVFDRCLRNLK